VAAKLGILAGRGPLPGKLARACRDAGRDIFIVGFEGETDPDTFEGFDHALVNIAAIGHTLSLLRNAGVRELVLLGPVARPDFKRLRPDWHGTKLLPKIIAAAQRGDDAIMKVIVDDLENEGFRVLGAEEVMSGLAPDAGALGRFDCGDEDRLDIVRGIEVVRTIGALDVGQAAVVRRGYVLAVEAAEGTDEMLRRCAAFREAEPAGLLIKLPKPGQERRADLPTIGLPTLEGCKEAGLKGIVLEAGGALIDDREAVIDFADRNGIFVVGVSIGDEN
jgi:DUF1009 family protein